MKHKLYKDARLRAKKDVICTNQCWNNSQQVPLEKGTIVRVTQSEGTRMGDVEVETQYAASSDRRNFTVFLREGHETMCPWDIGEVDDEVWEIPETTIPGFGETLEKLAKLAPTAEPYMRECLDNKTKTS